MNANNSNNPTAGRVVIYQDKVEMVNGDKQILTIKISMKHLQNWLDDVQKFRAYREATLDMNIVQHSTRERLRFRSALNMLIRFGQRWGHGGVPDDLRFSWNELEGCLRLPLTVFDDNLVNIEGGVDRRVVNAGELDGDEAIIANAVMMT